MNRTTITTIAAGLALLLLPSASAAQAPDTAQESGSALTRPAGTAQGGAGTQSTVKGLSLGIHGATTALPRRDEPSGSGLSLAIGYGVTDRFALHAATSGTWVSASGDRDSFFQSYSDVEGRYSFGSMRSRVMPHVAVGISGRVEHEDRSLEQGGDTKVRVTVGPTAGGGVSYFLSRSTTLDASVRYTFMDAKRTRVFFGMSWYPRAR